MTMIHPPIGAQVEKRPVALPAIDIPSEPDERSTRLVSLDIFRGSTISARLLVNNHGSC